MTERPSTCSPHKTPRSRRSAHVGSAATSSRTASTTTRFTPSAPPVSTADPGTILLLSLNRFPEHRLDGVQRDAISGRLLERNAWRKRPQSWWPADKGARFPISANAHGPPTYQPGWGSPSLRSMRFCKNPINICIGRNRFHIVKWIYGSSNPDPEAVRARNGAWRRRGAPAAVNHQNFPVGEWPSPRSRLMAARRRIQAPSQSW